ncbi:MAG TPA: hypothetical protein VEA69_19540 [Tepidisphaeraceae bacterium]|nr:hypothetical protein [Tepidisphaeraceae bacterium]
MWLEGIPCEACGSTGTAAGGGGPCRACWGRRCATLTRCPKREVDARVLKAIDYAACARHGNWPRAGGILDQTQSAVQVIRYVWSEEDAFAVDRAAKK